MKTTSVWAWLTPALFTLAACASETAPPAAQDAGVTEDAGPVDAGPQAARYLVAPKGLFGDTPVHNRFLNPNFDLNAEGWLAYPTRSGAMALPSVQRRFETATPTRQPLLVMPKQGNNFGVGLVGTARAGDGAFDVTVWIGRPSDAAAEPISVSVVGMHVTEGERAWDLVVLEGTEQVLAERTWVQYGLHLDDGPVGFANLVVVDEGEVPVFVTGPVMIPGPVQRPWGVPLDLSGKPRPVAGPEARALEALRERFRKDLGAPRAAPRLPPLGPRR